MSMDRTGEGAGGEPGGVDAHRVRYQQLVEFAPDGYLVTDGQGVIVDRTAERLGRSDAAVILLRKIWARELQALAEGRPLKEWQRPERLVPTVGL